METYGNSNGNEVTGRSASVVNSIEIEEIWSTIGQQKSPSSAYCQHEDQKLLSLESVIFRLTAAIF